MGVGGATPATESAAATAAKPALKPVRAEI
jgi:hypothetical protein